MTRRVVVEPEARLELAEASDWYDARNPDVGSKFLRSYDLVYDSIVSNPHQYQIVQGNVRRASFGNFPYSLFYRVVADEIVIIACFHSKRNPKRWQDRTPD